MVDGGQATRSYKVRRMAFGFRTHASPSRGVVRRRPEGLIFFYATHLPTTSATSKHSKYPLSPNKCSKLNGLKIATPLRNDMMSRGFCSANTVPFGTGKLRQPSSFNHNIILRYRHLFALGKDSRCFRTVDTAQSKDRGAHNADSGTTS